MSIPFSINTTNKGLWRTLANNAYEDAMQPISEILDNSIAAKATVIKINIDFDKGYGSIEDNGHGFPSDSEGLSRCFTYSPDIRVQTDLNEHGCGLKSSLAILDPIDESWKVTWKNSKIYQVKAPYSIASHSASCIEEWPGTIHEKTGTLIEFPIKKDQFKSLYTKKQSKMDPKIVLSKLKEELSQIWMKMPQISTGSIKIYLNEEIIEPFKFPHEDNNYVDSHKNLSHTLKDGGKLEITHYNILKTIPNSWFKYSETSTGFYMYKNGRLIQKIISGALYEKLSGHVVDNHYSGNIVIVNITGKQEQLPITVPTKNKFKPTDNIIFDEVIAFIQEKVEMKLTKVKPKSEEQLMEKFQNLRERNFASEEDTYYKFLLKEQLTFKEDNLNSPQIDAIEIINKKANVYEAKRENTVALCHIIQLYSNWILSIDAIKEQYVNVEKVIPILIIDQEESKFIISDGLKAKIKKLDENSKCGFPIQIRNYHNDELYKFK
jgi:hypothetical protein